MEWGIRGPAKAADLWEEQQPRWGPRASYGKPKQGLHLSVGYMAREVGPHTVAPPVPRAHLLTGYQALEAMRPTPAPPAGEAEVADPCSALTRTGPSTPTPSEEASVALDKHNRIVRVTGHP